jgi:hypothetical protein
MTPLKKRSIIIALLGLFTLASLFDRQAEVLTAQNGLHIIVEFADELHV